MESKRTSRPRCGHYRGCARQGVFANGCVLPEDVYCVEKSVRDAGDVRKTVAMTYRGPTECLSSNSSANSLKTRETWGSWSTGYKKRCRVNSPPLIPSEKLRFLRASRAADSASDMMEGAKRLSLRLVRVYGRDQFRAGPIPMSSPLSRMLSPRPLPLFDPPASNHAIFFRRLSHPAAVLSLLGGSLFARRLSQCQRQSCSGLPPKKSRGSVLGSRRTTLIRSTA